MLGRYVGNKKKLTEMREIRKRNKAKKTRQCETNGNIVLRCGIIRVATCQKLVREKEKILEAKEKVRIIVWAREN